MNCIIKQQHDELISILEELIETIEMIQSKEKDYLLNLNKEEAKEWLSFLRGHTDKEELKSLENEICDRFFYRFDVLIGTLEFDKKRVKLIEDYIFKSNEYLK